MYFTSINRNKRSVFIDLATDEGQAELGALAATAHALVVNMRPSAIRKLGLDYASLSKHNERLVCVAVTGFGLDGPGTEWPAFDYIIQAGTGVAAMTGEPDGPPSLAGYSAVDNSVGIMAALGLVAKVLEGTGGQVDVSLYDTMLSQLNYKAAAYLNAGTVPVRQVMGAHNFYVPAQLFETRDGHLAVFVSHDEFFRRLVTELGRPEWADDPRFVDMHARFENRAELLDRLSALLRDATAAEWVERFRPLGIPAGRVVDLGEALEGELVAARSMVATIETGAGPLRVVANPIRVEGVEQRFEPAPRLHGRTEEILGPLRGEVRPD